jgi:hypothetical protein
MSLHISMHIGIVISEHHVFANGLNQNGIFMYILCKQLGHTCDLLSYSKTYKQLAYKQFPILCLDSDEFQPSKYNMIITVAVSLDPAIYDACKAHNVTVVGYVCSNILSMVIEEFATKHTSSSIISRKARIDKAWVLESFPFMKPYIELVRDAPATLVPHLWSPGIIEYYTEHKYNKPVRDLQYNPAFHTGGRCNIIVMEPNINFVKTAAVPLLAAERFYKQHPDLLNEVFVFTYPTDSKSANAMLDALTVGKKVRKFSRLSVAEIFTFFNRDDCIPIIVSHQIYTPLNYTYYEAMYYGYPLVHNSPTLRDYEYHYDEMDVDTCAAKIHEAFTTHATRFKERQARNREYLETIDPDNKKCMERWTTLFSSPSSPSQPQ